MSDPLWPRPTVTGQAPVWEAESETVSGQAPIREGSPVRDTAEGVSVRHTPDHTPAWGAAPQAIAARTVPYDTRGQNSLFGHPGRTAANVRAGAERHPVGWVPALPAGFLNTVKPRDVQEAHRATLWPIRRPE